MVTDSFTGMEFVVVLLHVNSTAGVIESRPRGAGSNPRCVGDRND